MIRILLVGKRKQTVVWASIYLKDRHKFTRLRMLDGVKRIVKVVYGPIRYYDFPWEKRFNVYNAIYRSDPEAWIKFMERRIRKLNRNVVVDDPHYVNEVIRFQQLGFVVVRIEVATTLKPTIGRSLLDSEAGTVLLQEYFGNNLAYRADYTISVHDRKGLYQAIDELMLKLVDNPKYNITEGSQEGPNSEVLYEEEERTFNKNSN